jgi:hypothetical protein
MESKGITSMANIASKPPGDRDDVEKQFFVMFLKLRIPFFADFDKKTLRPVMERMLCNFYRKHQIVCKRADEAEHMMIVIDGELSAYEGVDFEDVTKELVPTSLITVLGTWGEDAMTEDETW